MSTQRSGNPRNVGPDDADLDNRQHPGACTHHTGSSPTAARSCTADIRTTARSLRAGLQACVYQVWGCYWKPSTRCCSKITKGSSGMVVVGAMVEAPFSYCADFRRMPARGRQGKLPNLALL